MIDSTYHALCTRQPEDLRLSLLALPAALQLCPDDACSWQAYVQIPLLHTLPQFVAERASLCSSTLAHFTHAHWCAGFWGLAHDRIGDGQARPSPRLPELQRILLDWWDEHLELAIRDTAPGKPLPSPARVARALTTAASSRARQALLDERRFLSRPLPTTPLDPDALVAYARVVLDKVSWLSTTTFAMLSFHASPAIASRFIDTFDAILLGMQCRDDALDVAEDRTLHGRSFPDLLGVSAADLLACAHVLLHMAVARARAAGFDEIAAWLAEHLRRPVAADLEGNPMLASFGGPLLAAELERHIGPHARAVAADYSSCLSPSASDPSS